MKLVLGARFALPFLAAFALSACASVSGAPQPPQAIAAAPQATAQAAPQATAQAAPQAAPDDLAALIDKVAIPHEIFTLDNGLTTIVHTDRKAPIVGVTVYYRVGSKHEPRGKTGFAHLFEHLMFGGSENVENFDVLLESAG